ncbi:MAG TPA: PKD domain-containing protein, partial [Xanthomonadales bacterium]|nr:PKD domain-containing protein [Xanthomonadales bacterium]
TSRNITDSFEWGDYNGMDAMMSNLIAIYTDNRDESGGTAQSIDVYGVGFQGGPPGNVPPTANFSFTTSALTANFTDSSSDSDGTIASRSWNFGDGGTSTATNPSRTYAASGTYSVTLTVTDNQGATNSITKSVTVSSGVNNPPTANYSFTTSGLTATFTDSSTDSDGTIASRSWNFGDGGTSTATNPTRTYAAAGTYSVQLTVTDNGGATNSTTKSVTVTAPPPNTLQNGVPVTGLGATTGNSVNYTMVVPAGASGLKFVISGGTGDADLYVKFGSAPTDTVYDCRPFASGNAETCNIATAQAGTYYVRLKAYSTFSGVTLTGSYTTGGGGQTYTNATDVNIPDNNTTGVTSNITVTGRTGNAGTSVPVAVNIVHTYSGDLVVDLIAPDGSVYNISNRAGGSADNIVKTVNLNLSTETINGTWGLRVRDLAGADTGYINSWSITM